MKEPNKEIVVKGARENNLQNIDLTIPKYQLTVVTGLSGSGKSSLAFNTLYAEGQRRYMETLSAYARQFIGNMEKPKVESISGLSPVIAIEQKTTNKNPRSTVGTTTEIYDFLRLLYARASIAYSSNTDEPMVQYTDEQIVELILERFANQKIAILSPLVVGRKGHYKELFEQLSRKGFLTVRVDGVLKEIVPFMKLDRYKTHFVELVVDKIKAKPDQSKRILDSLRTAFKQGQNSLQVMQWDTQEIRHYSRQLMCPTTGISYNTPAPHTFSFNSPQGACPCCNGLGYINEIDEKKLIPNPKKSIRKGGIEPLGEYRNILFFAQLEAIADKYGFSLNDPIEKLSKEALKIVLYGSDESFRIDDAQSGNNSRFFVNFEGVISYLSEHSQEEESWTDRYVRPTTCTLCGGSRLKAESLQFKINQKNIAELSQMSIGELKTWMEALPAYLNERQKKIAAEVCKEIIDRLSFLTDVGLAYLSLERSSRSLSGGESQRIRLATQIGSKLVNVLYILDEPSIGLHQRDNQKLIRSLQKLRDEGNTVLVVEHDQEMMMDSDYLVDVGPGAGIHGGKICFQGSPQLAMQTPAEGSLTLQYLQNIQQIQIPAQRRTGNGLVFSLLGATGNNLKSVDLHLPLGKLICVTGVSGSGKSSLINETLQPILAKHFYRSLDYPLPYQAIEGLSHIDKVVQVDQAPIGRTPRSNPATYTNVFTDIRKLFEQTPEARIRGFSASRFSFNLKGGRCETCGGAGVQTIEMNFLPDVYIPCKTCGGKRYNRETLAVRFKGKTINDVLNMTIEEALHFFDAVPNIRQKMQALNEVGLGYVRLGQASTSLSGGESQRVKLAAELAKKDTGQTLYILDEPTTGLHFEDIRVLMNVLNTLVDRGNTVVVIEHNLDVIKLADHIIDLGPEGGAGGGQIMVEGTPEEVAESGIGYTAPFLKSVLKG